MGSRRSDFEQFYHETDAFRSTYRDRATNRTSTVNALLRLIPYRFLYTIESWLHPPLAPRPMLLGPARTQAAKKELLLKILGMDTQGRGIMGSVSQASQRGLSSVSGAMMAFKGASDSPPGLGNLDNSCYQNSILQGLASLKPLPPYLTEKLRDVDVDQRKYDATVNLRTLIADLNSVSNNGRTIWTPPALKNMSTWQQQDAQEYFSKLLDEVDKEIAKASKTKHSLPSLGSEKPTTVEGSPASSDSGYHSTTTSNASTSSMRNPLEGLVAQRVACVQCGHSDGLSLIPFNCLTLSLGVNAAEHDLYELLDAYSHIESIEGVQCGKCTLLKVQRLLNMVIDRARAENAPEEKLAEPLTRLAAVEEAFEDDDYEDTTITERCKIAPAHKVNSTKTKQTVVARPPQSLVIHMNRSAFDENTGYMWKNGAAVRFPMTLDLGPWCLGSAGTYTRVGSDDAGIPVVGPARADEEEWLLTPRASMIAGDKGQSKISGPIYELSAVVTHFGRHENGHYICYRRFPRASPPAAPESGEKVGDGEGIEMKPLPSAKPADAESPEEEEESGMEWWRLSDETVYKVDETTVLGQGGVFMLFYDCVDPSSVLTAQNGEEARPEVPVDGDTLVATDSDASDTADEPAQAQPRARRSPRATCSSMAKRRPPRANMPPAKQARCWPSGICSTRSPVTRASPAKRMSSSSGSMGRKRMCSLTVSMAERYMAS
ncbi:hypothetical protein F5X68DRAFT_270610 [Plectosphaerella plurivora]|uniref:ubiquitinyl hydrolase 1 n=1 Tax=Plectosphaerella plurivora TaxID=936078 RepID=A0A9P8V5S9_9PEZI|nr:hypothetical protein F5X68DRAFT_270610 [Plectosphaerella plurivora]